MGGSRLGGLVDRSNVILDFVFDQGLLFVSLANIGDTPATDFAGVLDRCIRTAEGVGSSGSEAWPDRSIGSVSVRFESSTT
jgi:hypothetical protein